MSLQGTNMKINGLNLNVLVEGEGEPVVLLHGFPDSNYLWRGVIPRLVKAGYRVIAPDQRGFGMSDAPKRKENYDMELIAKDAVAVLDALNVAKAKLVARDWRRFSGEIKVNSDAAEAARLITLFDGYRPEKAVVIPPRPWSTPTDSRTVVMSILGRRGK